MGARKNAGELIVVAVVVAALVHMSSAATYTVGDNMGWNTPSNGADPYTTWANRHTFRVGDTLVFNFATGVHTAAQVNSDVYNNCNTGNTINLQTAGPATFTLDSPGTAYFVCTTHCSQNQKLRINVVSSGYSNSPPSPYNDNNNNNNNDNDNKNNDGNIVVSNVAHSFLVIFLSIAITYVFY